MREAVLAHLPLWAAPLIPTYGVLLSLSLVIGCWWIVRRLRSEGWTERTTLNTLLWAVCGLLLGMKAAYMLQYGPRALWTSLSVFNIAQGGFSLLGGLVGASLGVFLYLRRTGLPHAVFADACVPAMALGLVLTRIGCFLGGCDFGTPTGLPWGISFPRNSDAFRLHAADGLIPNTAECSLPVHPTQLYESLLGLVLLVIGLQLARIKRFSGQVYLTTSMLYLVARFVMEFIRGDSGGIGFGPFTFAQGTALVLLVVGALLYWSAWRNLGWFRRLH